MPAKKRYEILNSLPSFGPMYVPVTENGELFYSEGFAVQFYKSDGTSWVANFKLGWTEFKAIYELENQNLVVIAGGACYLMNPDQTNPISAFGVGYVAALKTLNNRLILQDQTDLTI